ncbi:MAG: hypothetical protein BAJALOKI1v1_800012 [Promethearchaeota archaeon]|nr:MAG: hypothetical protein BAJALOKI1v1_800012 [Candidatus Lokiarchaeota archaeon]
MQRNMLQRMAREKTFRYVYRRRLTLKIPCILCLLEVAKTVRGDYLWRGVEE